MKTVVCPGSFDPITIGHMDVIKRASALFEKVIVLVATNPDKTGFFTPAEKCALIERVIAHDGDIKNVEVQLFSGLLVEFLEKNQITAVVKGLRAISDFEYEFQMALTNHKLYTKCETVFLTSSAENMYLSSSIVKQIGALGGDISQFVPMCIYEEIHNKLTSKQ